MRTLRATTTVVRTRPQSVAAAAVATTTVVRTRTQSVAAAAVRRIMADAATCISHAATTFALPTVTCVVTGKYSSCITGFCNVNPLKYVQVGLCLGIQG